MIPLILFFLAAILFFLSALGVGGKVNLVSLGLMFIALGLIFNEYPS